MGRSPEDSVEPLGAERGIITEVEVEVTLERAIGVERGPAAAAHVVALVGALPRELDAGPAITIRVAAVEFSRHRDEAQFAETVLIELDEAGLDQPPLFSDEGELSGQLAFQSRELGFRAYRTVERVHLIGARGLPDPGMTRDGRRAAVAFWL